MKTIFVSSTFGDMQFERDAIQEIVQPRLNAVARKYGQTVSFCDLRWGINTADLESEAGNKKVLDVCLDEIDRCQRPMVVILGDRYGWIPDADLVEDVARQKQMQLEDLRISVTALEIEYGALSTDARLDNTLFYFREIENAAPESYQDSDDEHTRLLRRLKQRISDLTGGRIKTYKTSWDGHTLTGIEGFAQLLTEDLENVLRSEWEAYSRMTPQQKELNTHWTFVREKAEMFRARKPLAEQYLQKLRSGENRLILRGASGLGKSTLLSYLAVELEKERRVIPVICGLTPQTNTALDVLKYIVRSMEGLLQLPEATPANTRGWIGRLDELSSEITHRRIPVTILVDAADQLTRDSDRDSLIFLPSKDTPYVQVIMTCLPELRLQGRRAFDLKPISTEEKRMIISGILDTRRRELSEPVIRAIVNKPASDTPLYLSLLMQRLMMMNKADFARIRQLGDGMAAITAYQKELVAGCSNDLGSMSAQLMDIAAQRINPEMIRETVSLLAHSRYGLRQMDLAALMPGRFNQLDFAHFISYMSDCFLLRDDGRYDFAHKSIREGLEGRMEDADELHRRLYAHFASLDPEDEVRKREIGYHCLRTGDDEAFEDLVHILYETKQNAAQSYAARALYEEAMADDCARVLRMIRNCADQERDLSFLRLINGRFFFNSGGSKRENEILMEPLRQTMQLGIRIHENLKSELSARFAAYAIMDYAYELDDKPEELKLRQKAVALLEAQRSRCETAEIKKTLGYAYNQLGRNSYCRIGYEMYFPAIEALQKAIRYRQEADREDPSPANIRGLAQSYDNLAKIYGHNMFIGWNEEEENLPYSQKIALQSARNRKAIEWNRQAVELYKQLTEQEDSVINWSGLCDSNTTLADMYINTAAPDSRNNALKVLQEVVEIRRKMANETRTLSSMKKLADQLCALGDVHSISFKLADYDEARQCYLEARELYAVLMKALETEQAEDDYGTACLSAAQMLYLIGGEKRWKQAMELSDEAYRFVKVAKNTDTRRLLSEHCRQACGEKLNLVKPVKRSKKLRETYGYAYAETLQILKNMSSEDVALIPPSFLKMMRQQSSALYVNTLDLSRRLIEQDLSEKTKNLMAVIMMNYFSQTPEEQDRLQAKWEENERKYQESLKNGG